MHSGSTHRHTQAHTHRHTPLNATTTQQWSRQVKWSIQICLPTVCLCLCMLCRYLSVCACVCVCVCVCVHTNIWVGQFRHGNYNKLHKATRKQKFSTWVATRAQNLIRKSSLLLRADSHTPVHTSKYQRQRLLYMYAVTHTHPPFIVYTYFIYSKSKSQQCIQLKSGIEKWFTGSLHVLPGGGRAGGGVAGAVTVAVEQWG